jgi:hypothetical protein
MEQKTPDRRMSKMETGTFCRQAGCTCTLFAKPGWEGCTCPHFAERQEPEIGDCP